MIHEYKSVNDTRSLVLLLIYGGGYDDHLYDYACVHVQYIHENVYGCFSFNKKTAPAIIKGNEITNIMFGVSLNNIKDNAEPIKGAVPKNALVLELPIFLNASTNNTRLTP